MISGFMAAGRVSSGSAQFVPLKIHILLASFFAVTVLNQVVLKIVSDDLEALEGISPIVLGVSRSHVAVDMHRHGCLETSDLETSDLESLNEQILMITTSPKGPL